VRGRRAGRFLLARACFSGLCVGLSIGPTGVMAPGSSRPEEDRTPPRGGSSHPLHCNFRLYRNQIPAYGPSVLPGVAGPAVVLLQDVFGSSGAGVKAARFLRAEGCLDAGSRTARYSRCRTTAPPTVQPIAAPVEHGSLEFVRFSSAPSTCGALAPVALPKWPHRSAPPTMCSPERTSLRQKCSHGAVWPHITFCSSFIWKAAG
jgi:hypothetical protein